MPLIFYVFASFGFAFVLGYSKITLPLRVVLAKVSESLGDSPERADRVIASAARWVLSLLECPACVAFWLGLVGVFTPIVSSFSGIPLWVLGPALGFANTGAVLTLGMLTGLIRTE